MAMMITPLQQLLRDKILRTAEITQATQRSRYTVRRWRSGETFPHRTDAEKLIELFGPDRLDFNGCYEATVEVRDV